MSSTANIKKKIERLVKSFTAKPALGHYTATSKTRLQDGLYCVTEEGSWTTRVDLPEMLGGSNSAPSSGVLGRAALGSCLTIGYAMWAARLEIKLDDIEVEVTVSADDGGLIATSESYPGYLGVQYRVRIKSDAPHDEILKLIETADRHSPYLDVFNRDQECVREVEICSANTN